MDVCARIHARRARKLAQVPHWQSVTAETKFSPVNGNRGFYEEYNLLMPAIYKVKRKFQFVILPKNIDRSMLSVAHTACELAAHKPQSQPCLCSLALEFLREKGVFI